MGTYGQKPLYYGSSKRSPIYYGTSQPAYGNAPYYYGGGQGGNGGQDDSMIGTVTFARILRVVAQRWISILVFLLIGLVAAFAVYRISPTIYEAKSEFTMAMRTKKMTTALGQTEVRDYGNSFQEVFNTRISDWRSNKLVEKIKQQYRAKYPASTKTDEVVIEALQSSVMEPVRNSRIITIAVRNTDPELCAALANAYANAIENFTDEENKIRCDKAVAQIHEQVEKQRRADEKISADLLEFRRNHKLDSLKSERDIISQSLQKTTAELLEIQSELTKASEWVKVLEAAQETPENFGALPSAVPRSSEIGEAYAQCQKARMEMNALLARFTKNHPMVKEKTKEVEDLTSAFNEAVVRSLDTANGNLKALRNQEASFKANTDSQRQNLAKVEQDIVLAESGYERLEREKQMSSDLYKDLLQHENIARIEAEENNEIVRVGRPAPVPTVPVLPNPIIIFGAGAALSLAAGFLFVLMLDHLEDTVVSLSDIEGRLALRVLAVLPHIRRKKREQVARFIIESKYSQFSEAMAGLRNLLDSPRYQAQSQVLLVMSTQPGEGKTITSCSLAISNAQAGRKTLLVDFDLRRPRLAHVWDIKPTKEKSFSHILSTEQQVDFSSLVHKTEKMPGLDLLISLAPEDINPSSIMGSRIVADFFEWARKNYDRVVVDSPPFGIVGDVVTLANMVDGVLIMCCPDRTHFRPIQHASRTLSEAGATVLGVIVNDVEMGSSGSAFDPSGRAGYGYSSRYGYRYGGYGRYHGYGYGYGYGHYHPKSYAPDGEDDKPNEALIKELELENDPDAEKERLELGEATALIAETEVRDTRRESSAFVDDDD